MGLSLRESRTWDSAPWYVEHAAMKGFDARGLTVALGAALSAFSGAGLALADDDDPVTRLAPRGDPVVAGARYDAPSTLETPGSGRVEHDVAFAVGVVRLVNDGWTLGLVGRYRFDRIALDRATGGNGTYDLYTFALSVFSHIPISRSLTLFGYVGLLSASDLKSAPLDSFQPAFAVYATYALGDADALLFGVGLARFSGALWPVPLLGYVHQATGSPFRFDALLPQWIRAYYAVVPPVRLALGIDYDSDAWSVTREAISLLQSTQIQAYGGVRVIGPAQRFVEARGGAEVYQSYALPGVANGAFTTARPAPYAQLAVGISR
jgi:hypothetical protein